MKQIEKCVEAIKLAHLSRTPIVWVVTAEKEIANEMAICFAKEHFGGYRQSLGKVYDFKSIDFFYGERELRLNIDTPIICCDWIVDANTINIGHETVSLSYLLERFITFHNGLELDIEARLSVDNNKNELYKKSLAIIASPELPRFGWLNNYIEIIYVNAIDDTELRSIIEKFQQEQHVVMDETTIDQLIVNFRGLSERVILQVLTRCLALEYFDDQQTEKILNEVRRIKKQMLEGFNGLKWISIDTDATPATGLDAISDWLDERKEIFSDPDKKQREGYDVPKGVLVTGVPGTGKSLMAKESAKRLKLPLIAMDLGDIQEGVVGKSEEQMVKALRMIDAIAPCVLWIDEIEKAFSGANSGQSDGGVMRRMFGKFLTWMQEKESFCFVFATSNDISQLPPELFRSERFDEKFYNFMPTADECAEIFAANIKYHNNRFQKENDKASMLFDGLFEQKDYWMDFLNGMCVGVFMPDGTIQRSEVELTEQGYWHAGYIPQKKLFTGADISAFVKNLKFEILRGRKTKKAPNYDYRGTITKAEVEAKGEEGDNILQAVTKRFMPYGQTNLNDIAKCFFTLSKNRFKSASTAEHSKAVILFNDYNQEKQFMQYDPKRFSDKDNAYNRALYRCIVGAINNLSKSNVKEQQPSTK